MSNIYHYTSTRLFSRKYVEPKYMINYVFTKRSLKHKSSTNLNQGIRVCIDLKSPIEIQRETTSLLV
jgi:hypothetical protein